MLSDSCVIVGGSVDKIFVTALQCAARASGQRTPLVWRKLLTF